MQCDKNVSTRPGDQMPFEFECESARPRPDLDEDAPDAPDETDAGVTEEAGYGYGV